MPRVIKNRKVENQPAGCLVMLGMDALSGHGAIASGHGTTSNIVFAKPERTLPQIAHLKGSQKAL